MKQQIRTQLKHHKRVPIKFPEEGMTKQSHQKECDINTIMMQYQKNGTMNHVNRYKESYGFCTSNDLHESLNMIKEANDMFADLPSQARTKFNNDPGTFLDFVQDPKNEDQLFDLGLSEYPLIPEVIIPEETQPAAEKAAPE